MTSSDDTALALLLSLLRVARESSGALDAARRDMPDAEIGPEIERYAVQRSKLLQELERRVRDLRGDPDVAEARNEDAGARAWAGLKDEASVTHAILAELERNEATAAEAFARALRERDMDPLTRRLIHEDYELIQAAHARVRQLRERAELATRSL